MPIISQSTLLMGSNIQQRPASKFECNIIYLLLSTPKKNAKRTDWNQIYRAKTYCNENHEIVIFDHLILFLKQDAKMHVTYMWRNVTYEKLIRNIM